jgi:hypothetical protein
MQGLILRRAAVYALRVLGAAVVATLVDEALREVAAAALRTPIDRASWEIQNALVGLVAGFVGGVVLRKTHWAAVPVATALCAGASLTVIGIPIVRASLLDGAFYARFVVPLLVGMTAARALRSRPLGRPRSGEAPASNP